MLVPRCKRKLLVDTLLTDASGQRAGHVIAYRLLGENDQKAELAHTGNRRNSGDKKQAQECCQSGDVAKQIRR